MAKRRGDEFSRVMVFGTAYADSEGTMQLSEIGKRRGDKAAEAYYRDEKKTILVSGYYSKLLFDAPPVVSEARLLGDYLKSSYRLPESALLYEEESTNTRENIEASLERHPEFFKKILVGKEKPAIVSQAEHLGRIATIWSEELGYSGDSLIHLAAWQPPVAAKGEASELHAMQRMAVEIAAD